MLWLKHSVTNHEVLIVWFILDALSLGILLFDLFRRNREIVGLMKFVWIFSVTYSGPIGLTIYWFTGRKQISRDSLWRRGWRSTAHCYSGCGGGEIIGVIIAAGLLSLTNWWIVGITFVLAYVAGYALTVGPLIQEGVPLHRAMRDAFYSETASITVMEVTALGVDRWLAPNAQLHHTLFWSSLVVSLTMGLFAAYPVNVLLVHFGVKEGMHDPRKMAEHHHEHQEQAAEAGQSTSH